MRLKAKIGLISFGIMLSLVVIVGIYWLANKSVATPLKLVSKGTAAILNQTKIEDKLPEKIEPELVWQKEFDEEIVDILVPRMNVVRKKDEFPIVAVETEKDLLFLNKKGDITGKILRTEAMAFISENGKYALLSEKEDFEFPWDVKCWKYLTQDGKKRWEIDNVYGCPIHISPEGDIVIICKPDGGLQFYDRSGKVIRSYNDIKYEQGSAIASFSADGRYYVFSFVECKPDRKCEYSLILFKKNGEILWKQNFNNSINELLLSFDGKFIFVGCGEYLYCFNKQGNIIWKQKFDNPWTPSLFISPIGDVIAKINNYSSLCLINTFSGEEINLLKIKDANYPLIASFSPDSNFLSVVYKKKIETEEIYEMCIVSSKGKIVFQKRYSNKPVVKFSSNNKCFVIIKEVNILLVYEITF